MCAEFTSGSPMELERLLDALVFIRRTVFAEMQGRVFPPGQAPIIIKNQANEYEMIPAEFSLIPPWWNPEKAPKKTKSGRPPFATHNARLETVAEKPAFKDSFAKRHCLVPIYEFFESSLFGETFPGHRIKFTTGHVVLAAGCYSLWLDKQTGEIVTSFTIITFKPSKQVFESGHDRMPVFLETPEAFEWLNNPKPDRTFLENKSSNSKTEFVISIDRPLKDGWQKNAPDAADLEKLKKIIS